MQKKAMFQEKELGAIEIDISNLSHRNIEPSIKEIRREVLFTPENMEWIYNQPYDQKFLDIYEKTGIDLRKQNTP